MLLYILLNHGVEAIGGIFIMALIGLVTIPLFIGLLSSFFSKKEKLKAFFKGLFITLLTLIIITILMIS